ncbi:MAG: hypothetical protein ABIT37_25465 [Luteolibacter sp.]
MKGKISSESVTLRVPEEISSIIKHGAFPKDFENPLVVFGFVNGEESLFDTRKGLFLSKPEGIVLPHRDTLKAFGKLIQSFRQRSVNDRSVHFGQLAEIERFAVCS